MTKKLDRIEKRINELNIAIESDRAEAVELVLADKNINGHNRRLAENIQELEVLRIAVRIAEAKADKQSIKERKKIAREGQVKVDALMGEARLSFCKLQDHQQKALKAWDQIPHIHRKAKTIADQTGASMFTYSQGDVQEKLIETNRLVKKINPEEMIKPVNIWR